MQAKYSYRQLYRAIAASPYGAILVQNIRFGRFKPESIKHSTWERLLGPDVNNLRHMWFTQQLTTQYLAVSPKSAFRPAERHLLRLAATFHDLAESIVGDIPRVDKTATDEQHEKQVLTDLIVKLSQETPIFSYFKSDLNYCIEHILFPPEPTRLSRAFTSIEYLGYLHTACQAATVVSHRRRLTPLSQNLSQLATEVIENSLQKLETYRHHFSAIDHLLRHASPYREVLSMASASDLDPVFINASLSSAAPSNP